MTCSKIFRLMLAVLVFLFPAAGFAATSVTIRIGGGAGLTSAIDTLTFSNVLSGNAAAAPQSIRYKTTPARLSAQSLRNHIIDTALVQGLSAFKLDSLVTDCFVVQTNPSGGNVTSVKLNFVEIPCFPNSVVDSGGGHALQKPSGQGLCPTPAGAPSLTFYGLIALALLLAGMAIWLFRKRMAVEKAGSL